MNRVKCRVGIYLAWIWIGIFNLLCPQAGGQEPCDGIDIIEPKQIEIGSFFHGQVIAVKAIIPDHSGLIIRLLGPREDLRLMKKRRVGGIWMNGEEILFKKVPTLNLLWTSENLTAMNGEPCFAEWLDYPAQLAGCISGRSREEELGLVGELIKLKSHDALYEIFPGTIQTKPLETGSFNQAEALLHLPASICPGTYTLELIALRDGQGRWLRSYPMKVELSGFPAFLSHLAAQRGFLYGVLASVIATCSGLIMGVLFSGRRGH